ncbi:MAG: DUF393 domain-containing protein [Planctomycetota bacterium]
MTATSTNATPAFTLLIDGECPLCAKEASMMAWLDRGRGRLKLVDIAADGFDASDYGTTFEQVMGHIHGVMRDGSLVTGMEAFRHAYAAVGLGWLFAPTAWPVLRPVFDRLYNFFAANRLRFTGRKDACEGGRCAVPAPTPAPTESTARQA